jgi:hypothetical protein
MKNSLIFTFLVFSIFSFGIEVEIKDNKMIVDGKPFYMKGICYHPVKIGKTKRSFESLTEDLILIKEAGINTLRVYEPIDDIEVLDELQAAGIKVVISFGYNQKGRFDIVSGTFIDYVKNIKIMKLSLCGNLAMNIITILNGLVVISITGTKQWSWYPE